eukprot:CAMPEP_0194273446 /NCGR_PEP_ID=MMETSP0169-20130528/6781_1 /TAXON_ID=218684 /ORGANISM="Corethron pennatum, Strain L29A3" /LENGTH=69 /DNA_ID=CAMNT_0039016403 /DNA_START=815 /DNA_END=1024 /DNA_ORIENTATION=-
MTSMPSTPRCDPILASISSTSEELIAEMGGALVGAADSVRAVDVDILFTRNGVGTAGSDALELCVRLYD